VTDKKVKEKWVKQQVVKMLKDRGAYYFYPVASGYMSSGVPDIVACYKGAFIGIECKAGDNKPSLLQEKNLQQIQNNEGIAMVVNEDTLLSLQNFLDEMGKWK
jgi:Holliday junction resolvase